MEDKKPPAKKPKTTQAEPLLPPGARNEPEHPEPHLSHINSLEGGSFLHSYETLKRFLETLKIDLGDISKLESEQGGEPGTVIQSLQVLFEAETARCAWIKWAALDHLVEKWLQWPFLAKADLSAQSKCCTARVKPVQRSILLKSPAGLVKAYGTRGFVKGVEYTLAKSVHYFVYAMLIYRFIEWGKPGHSESIEFKNLLGHSSQKGIDTLIHVLSDPRLGADWLKVILFTPVFIGAALGLSGMYGSREISARELQTITDQVTNRLKKSGNFCRDSLQEYLPLFSQLCSLSRKLQKLERAIRWDGRLSSKERLKMFDLIHRVAQEGHQMTQLHAMECLAKIAHGIGFKDLPKLQQAGYSKEDILSILYTKAIALQDLTALTEARLLLDPPLRCWQIPSQFSQHIAPIPRRIYASYLLWWLGVSTSFVKQKLPFSTLKAAKLALEVYFLTEILKSVITAINCPDKPGFKFADGYADWASDYSLECFSTALQFFRTIDSEESIEEFAARIDHYHLMDLKNLDLSYKNLNATELYTLLQAIVKKAPQIKELKIQNNRFDTLLSNTFQSLSQLQRLDLSRNDQLTTLLAGTFQGLKQLQSLALSYNTQLTTLLAGTFQGLSQLQSLDLSWNQQLTMLPTGIFQGLSQLQRLDLSQNRQLTTLPEKGFQGLNQLQRLDLSHSNRLSKLPVEVFQGLSQLQSLDLSSTHLSTLPAGIFQSLGQLQSLDLGSNFQLTILPARAFQGLSQLQSLVLYGSFTIPDDIFQGLTRLQNLVLSGSFTVLPEGIFQGLNQLQSLVLSPTGLTMLPTGIFRGLDQLQSLSLGSTGLTTLPTGIFQGLSQLQNLSLGLAGYLITLPEEAFQDLSQLQSLSLIGSLTTLPEEAFQNLNQLKTLVLSSTRLTTLPEKIFQGLNQLQGLYLNANQQLTTLPEKLFQGLSQLQTLNLTGNTQLDTLPVELFQGLSQLQSLNLLGFTTLPAGLLQGLSQLQNLSLVFATGITILPVGVFQGLSQLQNLSLTGYLVTLPEEGFQGLSQLQNLRLVITGLTTLPGGVFQGLSQLKSLYLKNLNKQLILPVGAFQSLSQLQNLVLSSTGLTTLPTGVFQDLSRLLSLDLSCDRYRSCGLSTIQVGAFRGLNQLQYLSLASNQLSDAAIYNITQSLPYGLQTLDISYNVVGNTGVAAIIQLLPCSNISTFTFIPNRVPLNDTVLWLQRQRKALERVCADRACHANLPSKSCPPDSFYGRMDPKEASTSFNALYIPAPFTWVGAASSSLPTLSSCSTVSNPVVMTASGSALAVGSIGLGILFYKNCTILQSVVAVGQNFFMRCFYGKEQKPSAEAVESHTSSPAPAAVKTPPKRSRIGNFLVAFFKPAKNPSPNLDAPVHSQQQSMRL